MSLKKVAITTLGCKVNQYEATAITEMVKTAGYQVVSFDEPADIYIINTCTVTHLGDRKSRQLIRRAVRTNPDALVVVTGCYAQIAPDEILAIPGVDVVVGTAEKHNMLDILAAGKKGQRLKAVQDIRQVQEFEEIAAVAYTERTRAFLKVQEGCNHFCAYCIIPYARGPLRSRCPENALAEAKNLVSRGFKEIVLTGIHTGAYGKDLAGNMNLARLLRDMAQIPGLARLRLSSVEPMDFHQDLLDVFAQGPPLCRHIHIPLQSGDDTVLQHMRRHYTTADFGHLVTDIRKRLPGVAITSDIIVGFPGETTEQFNNTLQFVQQLGFAGLHVFKYSPRQGTLAAEFPQQVAPEVKEERSKALMALGDKMAKEFAAQFVGTKQEVLAEEYFDQGKGLYQGFTDNYLKVVFPGEEQLRGHLVSIAIESCEHDILFGRQW